MENSTDSAKSDTYVMVTIRCVTYNHEPYIRQCLEGFVMQKTTFRFEAIVHDDASTDGTANIIREYAEKYPNVIKPIFETENQYSKRNGSLRRIMDNHMRGKYIAMCEGDDYWVDPYKLQKQVEFLEKHAEYGLTFGIAQKYIQSIEAFSKKTFGSQVKDARSLLLNNTIPTPTVMFKKDIYRKYCEDFKDKIWLAGDYPLWLYFAIHSKLYFFNEKFAVYRILKNSASHSDNIDKRESFIKSIYNMKCLYNERYGIVDTKNLSDLLYIPLFNNAYLYRNKGKMKLYYKKIKRKQIKIFVKYLFFCKLAIS